ncbi:MAG: Dam family site-specific DNA-(adenine-N6)-methyltransferase [Bacteroidota bacterium]
MENIIIPPIKIQGKKTQLVNWIKLNASGQNYCRFIEPFLGSGVVGFNIAGERALFADSNPHIINFYKAVKSSEITPAIAKDFLERQGSILETEGQKHFNFIRDRFNETGEPLDFLFLNRACFNGMIRFNRKLKFNVPYNHKPERFAPAYVTKIYNQIKNVQTLIWLNDWEFACQDFRQTIAEAGSQDFIYCDPPYIGRHVDYFDSWSEEDEFDLHRLLVNSGSRFMVSTWHSNKYRQNAFLESLWKDCRIVTTKHFYHVGAKEENRNEVLEALIVNFDDENVLPIKRQATARQLAIFE